MSNRAKPSLIFLSFMCSLISSSLSAGVDALSTFTVQNPTSDPTEVTLQFKYSVSCKGAQGPKTGDQVRGYILYQGRRTILDFYVYRNELEVALGAGSVHAQPAVLELEFNSDCLLEDLQGQVQYENVKITGQETSRELLDKLALIHSPFINLRENQYEAPLNDTPLILAYSVHRGQAIRASGRLRYNRILRYTVFLSDEDNQKTSADTNAQMARYGRTMDVEWVYNVELNPELQRVGASYQGILHFPFRFKGEYLSFGERSYLHPILFNYNLDDNNVFIDSTESWFDPIFNPNQRSRPVGHHLVPRTRIEMSHSRDRVLFANAWTFKVSEAELHRQDKPSISPKDQLFVLVRGKMAGGSFYAQVTSSQGEVFQSGGTPCNSWRCHVSELGTDLWGQESFTAIPVGELRLNLLGTAGFSGEFQLRDWFFLDLELKHLRFFRLRDLGQTYGVEEVSSHFECDYQGAATVCRF